VLFVAWYKHNRSGFDFAPLTFAVNFTFTRMNKHLMFPIVRMLRRIPSRSDLENSHAEIICAVILADNNASRYSFCHVIVNVRCRDVRVFCNLHAILLKIDLHIVKTSLAFHPLHKPGIPGSPAQWTRQKKSTPLKIPKQHGRRGSAAGSTIRRFE
jgi:hypothetical protein